MTVIVRIERRCWVGRRESRRRGLADNGRSGLFQHHYDRRIRARLPAPIDRRAHLRREIRCIDDVLDADGDAAQWTRARRARVFVTTDEGADGLVMRADRLIRLRDRRIGRKLAALDTALKFGERDHGYYSLRWPDRFYGPGRDRASGRTVIPGRALARARGP